MAILLDSALSGAGADLVSSSWDFGHRRASLRCAALLVLLVFLAGCTSKLSNSPSGPQSAPSNLAYPQAAISATVGIAIATDTPTVTGTVTGYTISPALPSGLSLNSTNGAISGTPTAISPQTSYTVTASNAGGSTATSLSIEVVAAPAPPSQLVYPQASISATVGTAIAVDTPTVTGTVTSYSVTPALPAGLTISSTSGAISGTPTAASPLTSYTVTASNAAGSTTASVSITVAAALAPPSNLVYPQLSISATVGTAIATDTPTVTGTVTGYSISPALPPGLAISSTTGAISGTPTAVSPQTSYTVTASNAAGSATAALSIAVAASNPANAILELGQTSSVSIIRFSGSRVLTVDSLGHWFLWDYATAQPIAMGDNAYPPQNPSGFPPPLDPDSFAIAGDLAIVETSVGEQVISAITGQQLFTVANSSWARLATDGSYVCTGSASGLTVWSPAGLKEFSRTGDYSLAKPFAAPGQVEVALGAAGASVIETLAVPSGNSSISAAFSGSFHAWFTDGQNFLTNVGTAVWVYSNAGVQRSVTNLPSVQYFGGEGNWVWTVGPSNSPSASYLLFIYAIGSSTPSATYSVDSNKDVFPSGEALALPVYSTPQVTIVDLSGSSPVSNTYALPQSVNSVTSFSAVSGSQWLVGNRFGVVLDGATLPNSPRYFGYGAVTALAGSANNIAIATANGEILVFDSSGTTRQATIPFLAGKLELSSDGSVLAASASSEASQYIPDRTLNLYSLPSAAIAESFASALNYSQVPFLLDFTLSGSGGVLGRVFLAENGSSSVTYSRQVTGSNGSSTLWSDTGTNGPIAISPSGSNIATASEQAVSGNALPTTELWTNGNLVSAVQGFPEGWIDETHLLVAKYSGSSGSPAYSGSAIYDSSGNLVSTPPLPEISKPVIAPNGLVFDPIGNKLYSIATGAVVWSGSSTSDQGTVAGSNVVYVQGTQVLVAPY